MSAHQKERKRMNTTDKTAQDRPPARRSANPQLEGMASGVFATLVTSTRRTQARPNAGKLRILG